MEKLILLWLPLQGDVQCRDISSERYIVIICKLISTCDLMRRGFSLRRPGRASLRSVVLGRLRGSKYISLYCIASQLQIETQTGHLLPSYETKRKKKITQLQTETITETVVNYNKNETIQPDWLKTTIDMMSCS